MLDARQARRRYLLLVALRWMPTGLLIPITTLLALDRGLTLAEIGPAIAVQGVVVTVLELPTGGLADSLGRRPVLVLAGIVGTGSLGLLAVADSVAGFAPAFGLHGVFRALDSGPLEAWYVDTARAADPALRLDRALSAGTTVLGLAVATGALASSVLVAAVDLPGVPATAAPVYVALGRVLQGAAVVGVGLLAGPVGALTGYLLTNLVHGAANPVHHALVHAHVDDAHRATVLSVGSLAAQLGGSIGLVALTAVAEASTTVTAIVTGGVVLAAAAPLYLAARSGVITTSAT